MKQLLCVLVPTLIAAAASAQTIYDTSVTPNFSPGAGIPNAGFVVNNNVPLLVQTGLTSNYRFGIRQPNGPGDTILRNSLVNNVYTFDAGESYTNSGATAIDTGRAAWNFSYSANLNTSGGGSIGQNFTNNTVLLTIDWDPTAGVDQRTYNLSSYFVGVGFGGLTEVQDSQNLGFTFWDNASFLALTGSTPRSAAFNPFALGTYRVQLDVIRGGNNISSSEMFVNIVPTPGAAALLGIAGLAATRRRR